MIFNIKKTNYLCVELNRSELLSLMLGGDLYEHATNGEIPCLAPFYCSNPTTSEALLEELEDEWEENR